MNDPTFRTPRFFRNASADAPATSAHFERVPHPRASNAERGPAQPRQTPAATPAPHAPPAPELLAEGDEPRPTPPPARFQANFPIPPPSHPGFHRPEPAPASLKQLEEAIASLRLQASRLAEQARSDALEIGFQVARRILETELTTSAEPLFALVRTAVRRVGDARKLIIKLHPDDAARIDTADARTQLGLTVLQVEVVADSSLSPGDAVVETDTTTVDGRLSTRLDELKRAVSATLEEGPA